MVVNLVKLSVGTQSIDGLEAWIKKRVAINKKTSFGPVYDHVTRMHPRRMDELLEGGSIYWVIKGVILCRQKIVEIQKVSGGDGIERSALLMAPKLIRTEPQMRRAFQGWRYLNGEDAPNDLGTGADRNMPPELQLKLADLGLL